MTEETEKVALGGLASLAQDEPYTSVFSDETFRPAAAVQAVRDQIEQLMPRNAGYSQQWRIPQAIELMVILDTFVKGIMSDPFINEEGATEAFIKHPASMMMTDLIIALDDLRQGVKNDNFKGLTNTTGSSLKLIEKENIKFGLSLVELLMMNGKFDEEAARKRAAKLLKKSGRKVGGKEITAEKLRDWGRSDRFGNQDKNLECQGI